MGWVKRCLVYGGLSVGLPVLWYKLGFYDVETVKDSSFAAGLKLSQRFKKYPAWDKVVEPFVIRRGAVLFAAGHSFIKGMASDNPPSQHINNELEQMDKEIVKIIHEKD